MISASPKFSLSQRLFSSTGGSFKWFLSAPVLELSLFDLEHILIWIVLIYNKVPEIFITNIARARSIIPKSIVFGIEKPKGKSAEGYSVSNRSRKAQKLEIAHWS